MAPAPLPPPPGWGDDELSRFLDRVRSHQWATFANLMGPSNKLRDIDALFMRAGSNMLNPKHLLAPFFLLRAHSAFRAACGTSMAGQVAETFPLLRSTLEFAGYGLRIAVNDPLGEVWLRRHDDEETIKVVKREFTISNIRGTIEARDKKLAEVFDTLYQRAVDFGAHPNERSITGSMSVEEQPGQKLYKQMFLHDDDLPMRHALRTTAQVGICALQVLQWAFRERFELLGIRAELEQVRKDL
jgi:hypothetical protein